MDQRADLLVRGEIVTMDASRTIVSNGAVAIAGSVVVAVGPYEVLHRSYPQAITIGTADRLVTPGYVNAHQHLTGDRLIHSCIPDAISSHEAIFDWAVPVHALHSPDDDELSATLGAIEAVGNGITTTIEAGTVAHPDRVAAAVCAVGLRLRLGQWGWDVAGAPFAAPVDEVVARHRQLLDRYPLGGLVEGGVTLVGHDLMSDELVIAASALARERGAGFTFHMSPGPTDAEAYVQRTGKRPLVHLDDLGALGEHVLVAHGVHLDDEELGRVIETRTAIASCPWAYLRLAQGFVVNNRHDELLRRGGRVALGCDAENAGDAVDILRAATLFIGVARDRAQDAFTFTAEDALALATIGGADAVGMGTRIGSIEVGKQADVVVHDTRAVQFLPLATDPVRQLLWASDGRSVNDVIIAGREVVRDRRCITVDVDALRAEAINRRDFLLEHRRQAHG